MTKKEDVSNNLRPHQILNDYADRNKVIVMIQETMNPFDVNLDPDKLYNIGTGLGAIDSTQILKIGKMNEKHLLKNAHKDSQQCEKGKKAKCKMAKKGKRQTENFETENNYIRQKSFTRTLNARFVWEHFIHIKKDD